MGPLGFRKPEAVVASPDVLPSLLGSPDAAYSRRPNFLWSVLLHALALAMLLFIARVTPDLRWNGMPPDKLVLRDAPFILRCDAVNGCGGGGSGHDDRPSSLGVLPRISQMQLTPPTVHTLNPNPQLPVEASVVSPDVEQPAMKGQIGDLFEGVAGPASDGNKGGTGIGNSNTPDGGIGPSKTSGAGPGPIEGVYTPSHIGGVKPPQPLYSPDPEYSEEGRKVKAQGAVVLWVVIGADGLVREVRVQRSLGFGLDERAIDAVRRWRFKPATIDERPVAVQINVEVRFRLY
jgi:TonB family protein